jgi:hypothetical protein
MSELRRRARRAPAQTGSEAGQVSGVDGPGIQASRVCELITGHCLCGAVAYEYAGSIGPAGYCHCDDCRRRSGSAFGVSVRVKAAGLRITRGQPRSFTKRGDSGVELTRSFCPDCGSALLTTTAKHPESVYLQAGSLDDPGVVKPAHQSWTRSAVSWAKIDAALPAFEKGRT